MATIPTTALLTCAAIVGVFLLRDGFRIHACARSYAELDSRAHRAVVTGVAAFYANSAPARVRFDPLTAVVGPHANWQRAEAIGLNWGDSVTMGSSFLPSRTYREWGFLSIVPTRARVIARQTARGLLVQNALGATVRSLTVRTAEGLFEVHQLPNGTEALADPVASGSDYSVGTMALRRLRRALADSCTIPLEPGQFLAEVEGPGFMPNGGLRLEHHESLQIVRGGIE